MKKCVYNRYETVLEGLRAELRRGAAAGEAFLRTERELAAQLSASRATLRKALDAAESEGLFQCDGRKRRISARLGDLSKCGKIAFLSSGNSGVFTMPAMERLWNELRIMLLSTGADVRLLLTDLRDDGREICRELERADVILCAGGSGPGYDGPIRERLMELKSKKTMISLLEALCNVIPDFVVLDNYSAGAIAAEALLDAGCRRPFALWGVCDNLDFSRRAQGFADKLADRRSGGIQSVFWVPHEGGAVSVECRDRIDWAAQHGFDGLFLMSDECLGEIVGPLYARGLVPKTFRLVTMDGTRAAFRHSPPVSCVTHSSRAVAEEVVGQLARIGDGTFRSVRKFIRPGFCDHGSL